MMRKNIKNQQQRRQKKMTEQEIKKFDDMWVKKNKEKITQQKNR